MFGENQMQHISTNPLIPTVKHGGGGVMIWACLAATAPRHILVTESTTNSSGVNRGAIWNEVVKQEDDPKPSSKSATEGSPDVILT